MTRVDDATDRKTLGKRLVRQEGFAGIGRLAIGLIHELNNPLDGARRYLRLLIGQMPENDQKRMYVEQIQNGLLQISNVVDGLMDLTRASMSSSGLTDVKQSIEKALFFYRRWILSQNIKVEIEFCEDVSTFVNADMEYVFMGIVKNAIQAMPDGGVLSIETKMSSPQLFEARISDIGSGIAEDVKENIFDPFFTTKDPGHGIGLGLFIGQEIVESYSGTIEVETELGKGATFTVKLPMYKGKILVMDDEKHIRDIASGMLSSIGYKVIVTRDGAETIELYKEAEELGRPYDAVILDLITPGGIGGKETVQRLLEIDPAVKAVVSSGYSNSPIMLDFRKHGFSGALSKPYCLEELGHLLDAILT